METIIISDKDLYADAAKYAAARNETLTNIVERYLQRLVGHPSKSMGVIKPKEALHPFVQNLMGSIPATDENKQDLNGSKAKEDCLLKAHQ